MITKKLALKLFEGFSIERWNDMVRPFDLIEMDKAAEKMVIAYIIGKFEEQKGGVIDWDWMIYASLFELFRKIALCDIKSPVQRMIRHKYPDEYIKLNEWVIDQYKPIIEDEELFEMFGNYIRQVAQPNRPMTLTDRVIRAAHKFSAMREFEMIALVNEPFRLKGIEKDLNEDIQPYLDLQGLQLFITKQRPYEFLMVLEKLRFQTRWNQTPRIPKTSVLGHSFFVAILTLLLGRQDGFTMCPKRRYNNFFSGLFHDLPEAVTRDIISPVKQATDGLPSIVKEIEDEIVKQDLCPLMESFYVDELMYFTSDEFENRILLDSGTGKMPITHIDFEDMNTKYNSAAFSPIDGKLVRCADHISAFLEAHSSINHGITSKHLLDGKNNLLKTYKNKGFINGFSVSDFFAQFS